MSRDPGCLCTAFSVLPRQLRDAERFVPPRFNIRMGDFDPYAILQVSKSATIDEIKTSYRGLALQWHPDRHHASSEEAKKHAEEQFKLIGHAYEILSDERKRRAYDHPRKGPEVYQWRDPMEAFNQMFGYNSFESLFTAFTGSNIFSTPIFDPFPSNFGMRAFGPSSFSSFSSTSFHGGFQQKTVIETIDSQGRRRVETIHTHPDGSETRSFSHSTSHKRPSSKEPLRIASIVPSKQPKEQLKKEPLKVQSKKRHRSDSEDDTPDKPAKRFKTQDLQARYQQQASTLHRRLPTKSFKQPPGTTKSIIEEPKNITDESKSSKITSKPHDSKPQEPKPQDRPIKALPKRGLKKPTTK